VPDRDVPEVIGRYQAAHDRRDLDTALAAFTPDATVVDDGTTYIGAARIRSWLEHAASEFTYTRTLTGFDDVGDGAFVVRNHLEGDFPGGEVDLRYRFQVRDGLIAHLEIAP
jgi:ketosteroid isomerase-like protein